MSFSADMGIVLMVCAHFFVLNFGHFWALFWHYLAFFGRSGARYEGKLGGGV